MRLIWAPVKLTTSASALKLGMWKGKGKITLDDAERAVKEIKKLKFIGQDKIKATTMVVELPVQ